MCKSWRHLQLRQQLLLPQGHSTCVKSISIPIYLIIKQKFAVQFHQHLPDSSFWVQTEFLPSFPAHRKPFSFPPFSMPFSKVTSSRENITWITPTSAHDRAMTFCHQPALAFCCLPAEEKRSGEKWRYIKILILFILTFTVEFQQWRKLLLFKPCAQANIPEIGVVVFQALQGICKTNFVHDSPGMCSLWKLNI